MNSRDLVEASAIAKALDEPLAQRVARQYREWLAAGGERVGPDPLEEGSGGTPRPLGWDPGATNLSVELECEHGTCPGDAKSQPGCPGYAACTAPPAPEPVVERELVAALEHRPASAHPRVQTLTCTACGATWTRLARRGRPPKHCPECQS